MQPCSHGFIELHGCCSTKLQVCAGESGLENMFNKYARTVPDKLTLGELWDMTQANRDAFDIFGCSLIVLPPSIYRTLCSRARSCGDAHAN